MRSSSVLSVVLFFLASGMVVGQTLPAAGEAGFSEAEYAVHVKGLREKLPAGFTVLVQRPFVVIGDDTPAAVKSAAERTVKWAVEKLKKEYFAKDPAEILDVYLFKDKASYDRYTKELFHDTPETPYGYFSPAHRALIMNIATGGGTLVHEIVHPFVAANFPKCPTWFNEGLGSLYEQSNEREGRIIGMPNWRLAGLQEGLKNKTAPGFKELCEMDAGTFYGVNRGIDYSTARYLLLYLQEKGLLQKYYKAFVAGQEQDPTGYATLQSVLKGVGEGDMEAFRKKWEGWVMGLRFP